MSYSESNKRFISDSRPKLRQQESSGLDVQSLDRLLSEDPSYLNRRDSNTGGTLLFKAISSSNNQVAEYLLTTRNADPNIPNILGDVPLHIAIENANHKMINLLLDHNADPNIQNQDGETSMHIAANKGDYKVIKLLSLYRSDINIKTFNGYSILDYAAEKGNNKCLEVLQEIIEKTRNLHHRSHSQIVNSLYSPSTDLRMEKYKKAKHSRNNLEYITGSTYNGNSSANNHRVASSLSNLTFENNSPSENQLNNSGSFIVQMNNFEERIEKIKKELLENMADSLEKQDMSPINKINTPTNRLMINTNNENLFTPYLNSNSTHSKFNSVYEGNTPIEDSLNIKRLRKNKLDRQFTLNQNESLPNEDYNTVVYHQEEDSLNLNRFVDQSQSPSNIFELYYTDLENKYKLSKMKMLLSEEFRNDNKVLAVFESKKNDINEKYLKSCINTDDLDNNIFLNKANQKNGFNQTLSKQIEELFNCNLNDLTEYLQQNDLELADTKYMSEKKNTNENLLSKSYKENDNYTLEDLTVTICNKRSEAGTSTKEAYLELQSFLNNIEMGKYSPVLYKNGFDDLTLLIDGIKGSHGVTDDNLRDIGIHKPGHRTRILLKLEESANYYGFELPQSVFYFIDENTDDFLHDSNVISMNNWFKILKMENFTQNFYENGYHTLELLFMQMNSRNPLNEKILEEEIKITKIGYRMRLLNKLKDDSKIYFTKLKNQNKVKLNDNADDNVPDSCRCIVF